MAPRHGVDHHFHTTSAAGLSCWPLGESHLCKSGQLGDANWHWPCPKRSCDLSFIGGADLVASCGPGGKQAKFAFALMFSTQEQGSPIKPSARRRMRSAVPGRGCGTLTRNFMNRWRSATAGRGCAAVADSFAGKMSLSTMVKLFDYARRLYQALQLGENLRNHYEIRPNV